MSLLDSIGRIAGGAALALTRDATLTRGQVSHPIRASRHRETRPHRATESGRVWDADLRIHGLDLPVQPAQNDVVTLTGEDWIIWTIRPSPAGSHMMVDCIAPPAEAMTLVEVNKLPDGGGGHIKQQIIGGTVMVRMGAENKRQDSSSEAVEVVSRLFVSWPYDPAGPTVAAGGRVDLRGMEYQIRSIGVRADNPAWRRATLQAVT